MAKKKSFKKKTSRKKVSRSTKTSNSRLSECQRRSLDRLNQTLKDTDAQFHKGLDHNSAGEVNTGQFRYMVGQLKSLNAKPKQAAKNGFQLRRKFADDIRLFVNPQSGWATDSELSDPCCFQIPFPPDVNSEFAAAEAIEDYWMALLRDVPFIEWDSHQDVATAANELSDYRIYVNSANPNGDPNTAAPFQAIGLNHKSVFRGGELARFADPHAGISEAIGPFISQFLLQEIPYGTLRIPQRFVHATPGIDYMTEWAEWLAVQNGETRDPNQNLIGETQPNLRRHMATMRDLATYVHFDQLYQAYLNAALILLGNGYPVNQGNPYGPGCSTIGIGQSQSADYTKQVNQQCDLMNVERHCKLLYPDQEGFGTFGGPHVLSLVTEVATRALKAVWRQKWTLLRLRPEAYSGLVERALGSTQNPYNGFPKSVVRILKNSEAISRTRHGGHGCKWNSAGNALLPMAFPEGSPTHPAYGAGHATVAGACVTVLKAFFNGSAQFSHPVQASACGREFVCYTDSDASQMTVEMELNKLAANIAIGRDMAGVHWRSDYTQSMLLGQRVAIDMLYQQKDTYTEKWSFRFNSFGGKPIRIDEDGIHYHGKCYNEKADHSCRLVDFLLDVI
jgi:hypothetical protein